jgi:hypothetical protein
VDTLTSRAGWDGKQQCFEHNYTSIPWLVACTLILLVLHGLSLLYLSTCTVTDGPESIADIIDLNPSAPSFPISGGPDDGLASWLRSQTASQSLLPPTIAQPVLRRGHPAPSDAGNRGDGGDGGKASSLAQRFLAARAGDVARLRALLDGHAAARTLDRDRLGRTVLHAAAAAGQTEVGERGCAGRGFDRRSTF